MAGVAVQTNGGVGARPGVHSGGVAARALSGEPAALPLRAVDRVPARGAAGVQIEAGGEQIQVAITGLLQVADMMPAAERVSGLRRLFGEFRLGLKDHQEI